VSARLAVRVHPGAAAEGLTGRLADGTLKLAVAAPPEGGRANRAVVELLARLLEVRQSQVAVVRGPGSRAKLIEIEGLERTEVERRIERALERGKPA
jgi:uncharacterized protein YggU (UPF0235/DUF167 family)